MDHLEFDKGRSQNPEIEEEKRESDMPLSPGKFDIVESSEDEEIPFADMSVRVGIFTCFWTSALFGNLDTGVIPTTLHLIMAELSIT